jgi:hypothetical protein
LVIAARDLATVPLCVDPAAAAIGTPTSTAIAAIPSVSRCRWPKK